MRAGRGQSLARVPSRAHRELLERRPLGERELEAGRLKLLLRVAGERHARLPQLTQALRAEQAQVHEPGEGEQRLVGGDVRGRLLAPDVLLARLQREHVATLAREVHRLADDAAGQPPDVLGARREEPVVRPAVAHRVAGRLPFADRQRTAVRAGRLEHAQRDEIDVRDRHRARLVGGGGELRCRFEAPEEVGLLEDHGGRVLRRVTHAVGIGRASLVRHLDDLEPEARRVGLHDLPHLRVGRLGHDHLRAPRRVLRDEARVGGDGRAVVARGVRDVHPRQLADRGLVLEDRLEHALAHLGLVRRVRGQELAALQHRVDDRRDVMVVDAGAEEADLVDDVPGGEVLEVPLELHLVERRCDVELARIANAARDVPEQLLDGGDADRREHRLAVGVREREVAHCVSRTCLYAARSSSWSRSSAFVMRIRISQPSP